MTPVAQGAPEEHGTSLRNNALNTADPDDLARLTPAFTMVGGKPTHDPDKRLVR